MNIKAHRYSDFLSFFLSFNIFLCSRSPRYICVVQRLCRHIGSCHASLGPSWLWGDDLDGFEEYWAISIRDCPSIGICLSRY